MEMIKVVCGKKEGEVYLHWKDSASETPEVKATTSMGGGGNRCLQSRKLTRDGDGCCFGASFDGLC